MTNFFPKLAEKLAYINARGSIQTLFKNDKMHDKVVPPQMPSALSIYCYITSHLKESHKVVVIPFGSQLCGPQF